VVFEAPTTAIAELERGLLITEEVIRHLVVRQERPARAMRDAGAADDGDDESLLPSAEDEEEEDDGRERIDESESEAAPAAID
jgi:hypothetical protein